MSHRVVILGSSLTETPPNVKRVVVMLLREFHFHTYNILYIITLDMYSETQYNNTIETNTFSPHNLMTVLYTQDQKKQVRVTLTLSVESDFNARQIDWRKLFELEENEQVESYIEEL